MTAHNWNGSAYGQYLDTTLSVVANDDGGRIGISKLNPAYKLDVNGTFNASGNSLIGGTFGVTGATTFSSTLGVTGVATFSSTVNGITKTMVGLSNVDNTSDLNKPISTASGFLLANDWVTFNSKQNALNGTGFVKALGTSISYDNTSYLPLTGGTLTGALSGTTGTFNTRLGVGNFVGTPTLFTSGSGDQEIH